MQIARQQQRSRKEKSCELINQHTWWCWEWSSREKKPAISKARLAHTRCPPPSLERSFERFWIVIPSPKCLFDYGSIFYSQSFRNRKWKEISPTHSAPFVEELPRTCSHLYIFWLGTRKKLSVFFLRTPTQSLASEAKSAKLAKAQLKQQLFRATRKSSAELFSNLSRSNFSRRFKASGARIDRTKRPRIAFLVRSASIPTNFSYRRNDVCLYFGWRRFTQATEVVSVSVRHTWKWSGRMFGRLLPGTGVSRQTSCETKKIKKRGWLREFIECSYLKMECKVAGSNMSVARSGLEAGADLVKNSKASANRCLQHSLFCYSGILLAQRTVKQQQIKFLCKLNVH